MFTKILCKGISVIRRMNQWWDKDEEKEIATTVSGILILAGIIILSKAALFIVALIFIANRVLHRCNVWTLLEGDLCEVGETPESPIKVNSADISDFDIEEVDEKEKTDD